MLVLYLILTETRKEETDSGSTADQFKVVEIHLASLPPYLNEFNFILDHLHVRGRGIAWRHNLLS